MIGKSSRGNVERLNRDRAATTCILPSEAARETCAPSCNLRAISNKVCAATVTAPGVSTWASTVSLICKSRSVAIRRIELSALASINTFDKMGIVLRRSTTDCTWPRLFKSVARSITAFMVTPYVFAGCGPLADPIMRVSPWASLGVAVSGKGLMISDAEASRLSNVSLVRNLARVLETRDCVMYVHARSAMPPVKFTFYLSIATSANPIGIKVKQNIKNPSEKS